MEVSVVLRDRLSENETLREGEMDGRSTDGDFVSESVSEKEVDEVTVLLPRVRDMVCVSDTVNVRDKEGFHVSVMVSVLSSVRVSVSGDVIVSV